ncbi:hypothetical protein PILCRDRAFT_13347 [Piloderma croceum F 1598]|uniref:Uncharacterized protein n=1 Tax=Piloderma croceum (strain F 1598) TaxID=765440 RepID=A0A0C3F708_PILCF|nr:hypothetical protein PILCRDRAFT_13347 [Piloderma croceum F 1598]
MPGIKDDDAEGWEDAKQKLQNLFSIQSPRAGKGSCTKKQKTTVYKGNSRWTAQRKKKQLEALAKEAEKMPVLTTFFTTPSLPPDLYQLSNSELPKEGDFDLDLSIDNYGNFDIELFDYCYAEIEKELESQGELIGEEEANSLYKESVDTDQWDVEANDSESGRLPMDDISEADHVREWFDEEDAHIWVHTDILDIIKMHMKEVKKFHTPCAFKAFTNLTSVMQYTKL